MKQLEEMRGMMEARKTALALKQKEAPTIKLPPRKTLIPANPTLGRVLDKTPVEASQGVKDGVPVKAITFAQTEALLKGGAAALRDPIPEGYRAISKNQKDEARAIVAACWAKMLISFDFETNADQEEGVDILEDLIVGMSVAWEPYAAVYFPTAHDNYGANWSTQELIELFRELWESNEVLKIAFNIKFEHQILLRYGVRMPYVNVADPMIMVQMTAQFEELALKTVVSEILPYLFDKYGEGVLTENLTDEEMERLYIDDGDENQWLWVSRGYANGKEQKEEITLARHKEEQQKEVFWSNYVQKFEQVTSRTIPDGQYKTGPQKGQTKWKKVKVSFNEMPVDQKTTDYGCKDSDFALQVYFKLKPILEAEGLMIVHDLLDAPFMMVLGEMELNGWRWDPARLQKMFDDADLVLSGQYDAEGKLLKEGVYHQLDRELDTVLDGFAKRNAEGVFMVPTGRYYMGVHKREGKYLEIKSSKEFNWGSTQHLQWLFYHVLRLDIKELGIARSGKTGLPSTDADSIDKMIFANPKMPFFRTLLKKREYEKIRDTYAKGMLKWVKEETNRIHAMLKLVRTWRLSCGHPNLQNLPRLDNDDIGIRYACIARPGYMMCSTDYSQIELRVVAFYANDENMKDAYYKNQDIHSRTARDLWRLECEVEEVKKKYKMFRYKAKSVNFGELAS